MFSRLQSLQLLTNASILVLFVLIFVLTLGSNSLSCFLCSKVNVICKSWDISLVYIINSPGGVAQWTSDLPQEQERGSYPARV
jgi:hypothetical protein